jgi:hypothetical protein
MAVLRYDGNEKLIFYTFVTRVSIIELPQRIAALPRELRQEIVGHVGGLSMAIVRNVVFGTEIPWHRFVDAYVIYTSGIMFFKWVYENGTGVVRFFQAAKVGDPDVVKFLIDGGRTHSICDGLAAGGHLELLKLAVFQKCQWSVNTCIYAAMEGHLDVLKFICFLYVSGKVIPNLDKRVCLAAAKHGHLEVLQWLRSMDCPLDETICAAAAEGGHLAMLQWARSPDIGCPWDTSTCAMAAAEGRLELLQWARLNGCPWNFDTIFNARFRGHKAVLEWAIANGCPQ